MIISAKGNIYEFNAELALERFGAFVDGDANDVLVAISSHTLGATAQNALEASAEQLGFGRDAWAWVVLDTGTSRLEASNLRMLVEGLDPIALVACDGSAASTLSEAYSTQMKMDSTNRIACRTVAAFNNFESMLTSNEAKQKAWRVLKELHLLR